MVLADTRRVHADAVRVLDSTNIKVQGINSTGGANWSSMVVFFFVHSKCKDVAKRICIHKAIGKGNKGSSSSGARSSERVDCMMPECCHRVVDVH